MTIHFLVNAQTIKRTDENAVVADSRNYLYAEFSFSEEWTGIKTAVFRKDGETYNQILDENNRCLVPWEVLTSGTVEVSCFCGDRITAGSANVKVERSGYELGEATENPSPDVYAQLLEKVENAGGMHTFSENEHRVGTWINGKPLYEKTVSVTLPESDGVIEEIDGSDFEDVAAIEGYIRNYDSDIPTDFENFMFFGSFNYHGTDYVNFTFYYQAEPTEDWPNGIYYESSQSFRGAPCVITVRYTKQTDGVADGE